MNKDIQNEQRYWELTRGSEYITVFLSENKTVLLRNFKLKDIFDDMGVDMYLTLCSTPSLKNEINLKDFEDSQKEEIKRQIDFSYAIFLNTMIKCKTIQYSQTDSRFRIVDDSGDIIELSDRDINTIFSSFKEVYCLAGGNKKSKTEAKPITKEGEEVLRILQEAQRKVDEKNNGVVAIDSIILGVTSKEGSPYNLFNVWDLTIWQLHQVHNRMYKNDNIFFYNLGVYTGNIDTKKSKMKNRDLNWSCRD